MDRFSMRLCLGTTIVEDSSSKPAVQSKEQRIENIANRDRRYKTPRQNRSPIEHAGYASKTICIENRRRPARQKEEGVDAVGKEIDASWDSENTEDWIYASGKDSNRSRINMGQVGGINKIKV